MIDTAIAIFVRSEGVTMLERSLSSDAANWLDQPDAAALLDAICQQAESLDAFTAKLAQITATLAQKGLVPELYIRDGDKNFNKKVVKEIKLCVSSAYGREPTARDIGPAYFAALIRKDGNVVASSLAHYRNSYNQLATQIEAVDVKWRRQKVATALFQFIECIARFLMLADGFVCLNLMGVRPKMLTLQSNVDFDAPEWHAAMMGKLGFTEEEESSEDRVFNKDVLPC